MKLCKLAYLWGLEELETRPLRSKEYRKILQDKINDITRQMYGCNEDFVCGSHRVVCDCELHEHIKECGCHKKHGCKESIKISDEVSQRIASLIGRK